MTNQENNQAPKNTTETPSWRDIIRQAAKEARECAKDTADDCISEWQAALNDTDREEEAFRASDALHFAADWYGIAHKLEEALIIADDTEAAARIRKIIKEAGETHLAEWLCPIDSLLGKAAQAALGACISEAMPSRTTVGTVAALTEAYTDATRWG